jgi:hypothetical protein
MRILTVFLLLMGMMPFQAEARQTKQQQSEVYLLTILPGKEIYSMYGHSALRVVIPDRNFDNVFNWGVFDFSTPNFGLKFAKGRLDYMLAVYPYDRFMQEYFREQRTVISQRVNLLPSEKERLLALALENMKPENVSYRYDFFYDNCATRIRDIIDNSVEGTLSLSQNKKRENPTFRELIDKYQKPYRWLDLGIDLLLGLPADKRARASEQMFLPDFLMSNLSDAVVARADGEHDLLDDPEIVYDFETTPVTSNRFTSPFFILWSVVALVLAISLSNMKSYWQRRIDILILTVYSLLTLLLLFSTFFTDHQALKWNANVIWLSPLVIISLIHLIFNIKAVHWYRINLTVTALFLALSPLIPQSLNRYLVPVILILIIRLFFLSRFGKAKL